MKKIMFVFFALCVQYMHAQELALVIQNWRYGYLGKDGTMKIPVQYRYAKSFSEGLAAVEINDKWGFIDLEGKLVIPATFDMAKSFNSGIAVVQKNKVWMYINKHGETLTMPASDKIFDFEDGVAYIRQNEKIGLINPAGEVVLKPTYDVIRGWTNGHAKVKANGKWGIIDAKGNVVVDVIYEEIGDCYYKSTIWVRYGTNFGLVSNNKFKAVEGVDKIWDFFAEDLTYARKKGKIGYINLQGEWKIQPTYEKAKAFYAGKAPVCLKDRWGYIDQDGKVVVPLMYANADIFSRDGLAPVKVKDWGFINESGKMVIPAIYELPVPVNAGITVFANKYANDQGFVDGLSRVRINGEGFTFIDVDGNVIGKDRFYSVELFQK